MTPRRLTSRRTRPRRPTGRARALRTYAMCSLHAFSERAFSNALTLDRTRRQTANELPLSCDEECERRYRDHDDPCHDDTPAGGLLEAQLGNADLRRAHERLVGDEERPEVLVV